MSGSLDGFYTPKNKSKISISKKKQDQQDKIYKEYSYICIKKGLDEYFMGKFKEARQSESLFTKNIMSVIFLGLEDKDKISFSLTNYQNHMISKTNMVFNYTKMLEKGFEPNNCDFYNEFGNIARRLKNKLKTKSVGFVDEDVNEEYGGGNNNDVYGDHYLSDDSDSDEECPGEDVDKYISYDDNYDDDNCIFESYDCDSYN